MALACTLPRWAWAALQSAAADDPFALGVASGDPAPDGMVLWTRLLLPAAAAAATVQWEIAHDAAFRRIAQRGQAVADAALAHSVHVEAAGLEPDRWYFYRFMHGGAVSAVGRTRTAPAPGALPARLRLAYASCQRWEHGYYAAWRHLVDDAPDLVAFLGDYIYGYAAPPQPGGLPRTHPLRHARTLADYRDRYALHKSDPDLQAAHRACPWIVTWDDHEVENDYAGGTGRQGATDAFVRQRTAAWQAFYERMPLRASTLARGLGGLGAAGGVQLYRSIGWGRLAQVHLLDDRQFRAVQACREPGASTAAAVQPGACAALADPARSLLGAAQEAWLDAALARDAAGDGPHWSVIAQQTLFSPRRYPSGVVSTDNWDGYPAARERLLQSLQHHRPRNTVLLGGDIHQNYVCRVHAAPADPASPVVASEFCGTSITSHSGTTQQKVDAVARHNPHVLLADCDHRGYGLCDVTPSRWTTALRVVDDAARPDASIATLARFVVEDGRPGPQAA
nr:alkaline phosphatase D family protein [Xylophilus sp.]